MNTASDDGEVVEVLVLPEPLLVDVEVLGRTYPTRIGGHLVQLTFPVSSGHPWNLDPPSGLPVALASHIEFQLGTLIYGTAAKVHALMLTREVSGGPGAEDAAIEEIGSGAHAWFEAVRSWLASWRGADTTPDSFTREAMLRFLKDGAVRGSARRVETFATLPVVGATSVEVQASFVKGATGTGLPLVHELLLASRNHWVLGNYRQSVIDACTAAEVALSEGIQEVLPSTESDAVERFLRVASGVVQLCDLYQGLRGLLLPESPKRVANTLARCRNLAVHEGASLDHVQVGVARDVASKLVQALCPLPEPGANLDPS